MRSFRGIAIGVALVAMLAGCNGEETAAAPSPSPSASESTPSDGGGHPSTAPALPAKARTNDEAGAVAFVRYYVRVVNHAAATGDVADLRVVAARCSDCQELANLLESTWSSGGSITPTPMWTLRGVDSIGGATGVVTAAITEPPVTRVSKAGAEPVTTDGGQFILQFRLRRGPERWSIIEASRV
jgi:hypothetical protein